jgi:hypothetical protein
MTCYLENVQGLDPVGAGARLLMTGMLIIGTPLSGTLITGLGPRVPIVAGCCWPTVALFGLSRLGPAFSPTTPWSATRPVELAGVASGLESVPTDLRGMPS